MSFKTLAIARLWLSAHGFVKGPHVTDGWRNNDQVACIYGEHGMWYIEVRSAA